MDEEKVRFGGMALANGVLVHGPSSWACAVRLARAGQAGTRAAAPARDERADIGTARGSGGRPARMLAARTWRRGLELAGFRPRFSTSRSRRCGRATTATSTAAMRARC